MKEKKYRRRPDPRRLTVGKAPKDHVHVGLCLLYSGSGFRGLQFQTHAPTCHTVEGVLIQALKDGGIIAEVVRGRPGGEHHHFARSCRTDRGVHAIRNMVSLFIGTATFDQVGRTDGIRDTLNKRLPPMVRVAHVVQLSGNFIPRHCCNRRVYRYMLPLYALLPPCDTWASLEKYYPGCLASVQALAAEPSAALGSLYGVPYVDLKKMYAASAPKEGDTSSPSDPPQDATPERSIAWVRDLHASVGKCNAVLRDHFKGSRRYHNFSVDIDSNRSGVSAKVIQPTKDEALRVLYRSEVLPRLFLYSCEGRDGALQHGDTWKEYHDNIRVCAPPASMGPTTEKDAAPSDGGITPAAEPSSSPLPGHAVVLPFLFFQVEGGSFLLNMIRKIVGTLLAVCRGARESLVEEALSPERRVTTPLAPGPYLYLAQSTYHGYDRSIGGGGACSSGGGPSDQRPRLVTIQEAWSGAVSDAAEAFAFHNIAADILDVDLNVLPPLDDILVARDRAMAVRRAHTLSEDAHLSEMKEYRPVLPTRTPWPASSEMTIFLRLLRVHNWNVRPLRLDTDCKALREVKNRYERATDPSAGASDHDASADGDGKAAEQAVLISLQKPSTSMMDDPAERSDTVVPQGGEDGWLYEAGSLAEERALRQAYFASWWKRARPWEHDRKAACFSLMNDAVGGEDDEDEHASDHEPSRRRQRQQA